MNKKGQALVEFIIILPILILILFAIIDYGMITYSRNRMDNIINDISKMYFNNETKEEINKFIKSNDNTINIDIKEEAKYINIKLNKEYEFITPGLNKIFNNKLIEVERKIYNE